MSATLKIDLLDAVAKLQPDRLRVVVHQAIASSEAFSVVLASFLLVAEEQTASLNEGKEGDEREGGEKSANEVKKEGHGEVVKADEGETLVNQAIAESATVLLKRKRSVEDIGAVVGNDGTPLQPIDQPRAAKRLKPRYLLCHQCEKDYDVTQNSEKACGWHPGELEQDDSEGFWDEHEEEHYGRIEDLKDDYPEAFKWDCCGGDGESVACQVGWHMP